MATDQVGEVDLQFVSGDNPMSGLRTAEQADQGDLGWDDGDGSEEDAEGSDLIPDPDDDSEFITIGNTERVYSALEEFIVTIIEVWDDPSDAYMPTMQLRTLDGLLVCTLDSRDMQYTALVTLMADDIYETTHAVEFVTEEVEEEG